MSHLQGGKEMEGKINNKRDLGALASATNLHGYKLLLLSLLCYRQKMMDDVSEEGFNTWVGKQCVVQRTFQKEERSSQ